MKRAIIEQSNEKHIKAVIYIRESSDESVKNSNGPEIQLRECHAYAQAMGFDVIKILQEENVSGRIPIAERPRGAELWHMIINKEIGAVIAARKDRYSRDEWGIELPTFLRHCTEQDVQVHAVNEGGHLRADMAGRIQASFGDIMNGEERIKITMRLREGRRRAWEKGLLIHGGHSKPFGFRKVSRTIEYGRGTKRLRQDLEIDPAQADVVRQIYRLLIEERLSIRKIVERMGRNHPRLRHRKSVFRILKNPIYKGEFNYGDFGTLYRQDLAIVDAETFAAAQEQLKQNSIGSPRSVKGEYLLRRVLYCHCGRMLYSRKTNNKHKYECPTYENLFTDKHDYFYLDGKLLDAVVWEEMVKILSNRELLHRAAQEYVAAKSDAIKPLQARLSSYRGELTEAENDADEYIHRAGRKGLSEELIGRYEMQAQKALDRAKEIRERITKTENELAKIPRYDASEIDRIADLAQFKFQNGAPTFEQKRAMIEWADLRGDGKSDHIEFKMELGIGFNVPIPNSLADTLSYENAPLNCCRIKNSTDRRIRRSR